VLLATVFVVLWTERRGRGTEEPELVTVA
jgi:hypothetical protein